MNCSTKTVKTFALAAMAVWGFNEAGAATQAQINAVKQAFGTRAVVSETAAGAISVTLKHDIEGTVTMADNLGPVTVNLNGEDIDGTDGRDVRSGNGGSGHPAIHITASGSSDAASATVLTLTSTRGSGEVEGGEGGDGSIGGNGGTGILAEGISSVVVGSGVLVEGGEGGDATAGSAGKGGTGISGSYSTVSGGLVRGGLGGESRTGRGASGAVSDKSSGASAAGGTSAGGGSSAGASAPSGTVSASAKSAVATAFGPAATVSASGSSILVTLNRDIERTVTLSDDLGAISLDLRGNDIDGTDAVDTTGKGSDGKAAIVITASGSSSNPTVLTVKSTGRRGEIEGGEGGDGYLGGGNGGAGILAGGVSSVIVAANVLVEGGDGGDGERGSVGGNGGAGISGTVSANHGIVRGGEGGESVSKPGSRGAAIAGSASTSGGSSSSGSASGGSASGRASSVTGYTKSQTLTGVVCDADGTTVEGVVELKVGKLGKNGTLRVSAKATLVDGTKASASSVKVSVDETGYASGTLTFKKVLGSVPFELFLEDGVCTFSGYGSSVAIESASVGGKWTEDGEFGVEVEDEDEVPGELLSEYLPDGEPVYAKNGKWSFDRAASLRYVHGEIKGADDPKRPNLSGLKVTYTPKTGVFKGSFKVYSVIGGKLKKYTAKVNGVVVDGEGTGYATIKSLGIKWPVSVQ
ncbi:MAG: hypothetical protein K6F50_02185 [Kiritimatiellae bacterium]|nr:hypothetical protein [Kiritimatiellia bacterium]